MPRTSSRLAARLAIAVVASAALPFVAVGLAAPAMAAGSAPTHHVGLELPAGLDPQIQDYVGACDAAFVLDNRGSDAPVTYTVAGIAFIVPARGGVHTDADGTRIRPVGGSYVVTTDAGRSWTFPARECASDAPAPVEAAPVDPAPAKPTPTDPTPAEPTPTEPTPAEPTPTEPTPAEPTPAEPTPAEPAPAEPTPTDPTPADPTPAEPAPSEPGVDAPAVEVPAAPSVEPVATIPDLPSAGDATEDDDIAASMPEQADVVAPVSTSRTDDAPAEATPVTGSATSTSTVAALPRTGAGVSLLALLLGSVLLASGAAARLIRR